MSDPQATAGFPEAATLPLSGDPSTVVATPAPAVPGYEILAELGRGGMGVVYQARHVPLNRVVALKMILAGPHANEQQLARFRAEAEAVAQLQHPHIVQVFEVGEQAGLPYFSLEFCAGGSLDRKLAGQPQPAEVAAQLIETLARAMQAAHDKGVVHRDLKPANVLLAGDGTPKITDFGLAKKLDAASGQTHTGAILGTPSYMAPEQAEGKKEVGPLVDVYALGAILYECLTGGPPFRGVSVWDTVALVVTQDPVPPRALNPACPRDLEVICLACLAKDPARRYASAADLADDLQRFLNGEPIRARPAGAVERMVKWLKRHPTTTALLIACALALLALVGVGAYFTAEIAERNRLLQDEVVERGKAETTALEKAEEAETARGAAVTARGQAEEAKARAEQRLVSQLNERAARRADEAHAFGAMSLLAQTLPLVQDQPEVAALQRQRLAELAAQSPDLVWMQFNKSRVVHTEWTPDGKHVFLASADRTARLWSVPDGKAVGPGFTAKSPLIRAALAPDGKHALLGDDQARVYLVDLETGQEVTPTLQHPVTPKLTRVFPIFLWIGFRANGTEIVSVANSSGERVEIVRRKASDGTLVADPLVLACDVSSVGMHPEGHTLTVGGGFVTPVLWTIDLRTAPLTAKKVPPVAANRPPQRGLYAPDGQLYYYTEFPLDALKIHLVPAGGTGKPIRTTTEPTRIAFAPDNKLVALGSSTGQARLYKRANEDNLVVVLEHAQAISALAFAPDGKRIATASNDQTVRVWNCGANLSKSPATPYLRHGRRVSQLAFSPDGRYLVTACEEGVSRLWDLHALAKPEVALARASLVQPESFSADLSRVLTVTPNLPSIATPTRNSTARLHDLTTGQPIGPEWKVQPFPASAQATHAVLSPDGRYVAGVLHSGRQSQVWEADTGKPLGPPLDHPVPGTCLLLAFSPDGKYLVSVTLDGTTRLRKLPSLELEPGEGHLGRAARLLVFSPDNRFLAACTAQGTTVLPRPDARGLPPLPRLMTWRGLPGSSEHATFSPDSKRIAVAGSEGEVRVYDISKPGNAPPLVVLGHNAKVTRVAFSRDGRRLATTTDDGTARVWEVASGTAVAPAMLHERAVTYAAFNATGTRLVTASNDGTARVWEVATGTPVTLPLRCGGPVRFATFTDDTHLLTASSTTLHRWTLRTNDDPAERWTLRAQLLSGFRVDERGLELALDRAALAQLWQRYKQ